ncbi:hypothetical protein COMNV_00115 [Commensalibacter sp. Nvir]|uniref:RNA-binding protein n=1 Tax=Commensalibacter sp. Nvir TaxID=3069817 RepID=UPI002D71719F|nr:hypothetical protein COMNV_00115 [Commensalibacter sp. Nvir]
MVINFERTDEHYRCCVVTKEKGNPEELIRFVLSPNSEIIPDLTERLPGRGMWLKADRNVLHIAMQRHVFSRVTQCQVKVPENIISIITEGLKRRIKNTIGFARRAGQVTYGFEKVREKISQNKVALIIQAVDGSSEEKKRLLSGTKSLLMITFLTAEELGKLFGRERVVHAAIHVGSFAHRIGCDYKRLVGFIN